MIQQARAPLPLILYAFVILQSTVPVAAPQKLAETPADDGPQHCSLETLYFVSADGERYYWNNNQNSGAIGAGRADRVSKALLVP
jgi:hypothetical protein